MMIMNPVPRATLADYVVFTLPWAIMFQPVEAGMLVIRE